MLRFGVLLLERPICVMNRQYIAVDSFLLEGGRCWKLEAKQLSLSGWKMEDGRSVFCLLCNVQLLALLPHRHAKAAALRWGPLSLRIGG